jgi:hypothetical protein
MNADLADVRGSEIRLRDWPVIVLVIALLPLLIPAVLIWFLILLTAKSFVLLAIWLLWLPRGKDLLVVYSRSPHWMQYFEAGLIPLIEQRGQILNWSDRTTWPTLDLRTLAFRAFAGDRSFNPIVIVFRPLRWPERFRFFEAFKDHKHGKDQPLRELEERLERRLGASLRLLAHD